ncbi:MAG: DUF364 domain-containing protein, partial [Pseudomonadota bacterium]
FLGSRGHAFTDTPISFDGTLFGVLELDLTKSGNRSVFTAAVNAIVNYLGMAGSTVHCTDNEPDLCGRTSAWQLMHEFGTIRIALIGYQPDMLRHLVDVFSTSNIRCSDLNERNINEKINGIGIEDGATANIRLVEWSDLALVTSTTIVNDTFDEIFNAAKKNGKQLILYGVSGAGLSALLGLRRMCALGH